MQPVKLSAVALSFVYRLVRRVVDFVLLHRMEDVANDAEILLLRHRLAVLRAPRPRQLDGTGGQRGRPPDLARSHGGRYGSAFASAKGLLGIQSSL